MLTEAEGGYLGGCLCLWWESAGTEVEFLDVIGTKVIRVFLLAIHRHLCSARDWDGKDYLRIIPRVVW